MFKVDLHTHSTSSPDGGISAAQYEHAINTGLLDVIAITDHNRIDFATQLQGRLGEQIIVGEEIMTASGEIIGLFLTRPIQPGLSALETVQAIRQQGGLVLIPHPFETVRKGIHPSVLEEISEHIDIIEIYNGRAFVQDRSHQAAVWAKLNRIPGVASSDSHGIKGLGRTYTSLSKMPSRNNLIDLLTTATPMAGRPSLRSLLYPKYHRLRKKVRRT